MIFLHLHGDVGRPGRKGGVQSFNVDMSCTLTRAPGQDSRTLFQHNREVEVKLSRTTCQPPSLLPVCGPCLAGISSSIRPFTSTHPLWFTNPIINTEVDTYIARSYKSIKHIRP